jgi:hypothetical protein
MRLWKPPHTCLSLDADVSFMLQTRAARLGMFLFCASRLRHQYSRNSTSVRYRHEWLEKIDKTQTRATWVCGLESESRMKQDCVFCLCLDACLDAVGVRSPYVNTSTDCYSQYRPTTFCTRFLMPNVIVISWIALEMRHKKGQGLRQTRPSHYPFSDV